MTERVEHYQMAQRYKVVIERAASSTKGIDGFKVESNGDDKTEVLGDALTLYSETANMTSKGIVEG